MTNGEHGLPAVAPQERRRVETLPVSDQACAIDNKCYVCGGKLKERRLKKHCTVCGTLCETCCDNGKE